MPALTRNQYDILVLAVSWIIGFLPLFLRRARLTWVQCVGIALVASPFVKMLLNIYLSIGALFTFTVLEPVGRNVLWRSVGRDLFYELTLPLVGILLLHNAIPFLKSRRVPPDPISRAAVANGLGAKESYHRDALRGFTLFFCIAAAYLIALFVSRQFSPELVGGSESEYWKNITLPLIILISGMAGLTEEILFRGILLTRLSRSMPWIAAALVQALFFGFIHAGYGTWTHVFAPFLFGLGMAWVTRFVGIVPAILLHMQVNIMFFALDVSDVVPSAWAVVGILTIVNIYAAARTRFDAIPLLWNSLRPSTWRQAARDQSQLNP